MTCVAPVRRGRTGAEAGSITAQERARAARLAADARRYLTPERVALVELGNLWLRDSLGLAPSTPAARWLWVLPLVVAAPAVA